MRVPVVYYKPGACFPIVDNHIRVYAYETDDDGIVIHASIHTIHINEPLSTLRDKYAVKSNVYPHEIEMFYDDKELFDNDTCSQVGIQHEQIIKCKLPTIHVTDGIERMKVSTKPRLH